MNGMKGYPYITVTEGMSGWFAVMIWWNPDIGGFPEPLQTGIGRYQDKADAITEGLGWAAEEKMRWRAP